MSKVGIIKCVDYNSSRVIAAVKDAVNAIGGIEKFVKPNQKVLLKPNFLKVARPEEAVITHPEFIRAVIRLVKEKTPNIFLGDSPGGLIKAEEIYERCGINRLARQENITLVKFDRITKINSIPFAKIKDEVDVIISLPKFKTHNLTMISAAVKNVFGFVPGLHKAYCHKNAPNFKVFSKELVKIYSLAKPHLNIVDAILAMDGEGPAGGNPYKLGIVVASSDAVAADAVLSKIVGLDPFQVISTRQAHCQGLGQADINQINIVGESLESVSVLDFKLPKILALYRLPNFITKSLLRFIPLIMGVDRARCNSCLMCKNICPQQAITQVGKIIKIDFRRCILCLCCSEVCPNNAIYLRFSRKGKKSEE